ncbi:MAG: endonuclease/exonuclease/phosphatase family protein [Spirochaetes bacterium]|nr:endonuclease/exonuclease/phosphatase family protein [Spirochaetota bacterium]
MTQGDPGDAGAPAGPDPALIRFATFNVRYGTAADGPNHWDLRKSILLDAVRAIDPHVMGVQECMPFQGDEIRMCFPHMDRLGVGRYHGVPIETRPQESRSGEHCDIFFDSRRFIAESCGTFWHSETPEVPGSISWGNPYPRITTWAILRFRAGNGRFAFFCTHYHGNEPCCTKATDLMIDRMRRHAGGLPCVVVGDFNLPPDNPNHDRLTDAGPGGLGLRDVWQLLRKPEQDAGTGHDFAGKPNTRIDWILVGREFTPISVERSFYQRGGRFPSDHFPLVAQFAPTGALSG